MISRDLEKLIAVRLEDMATQVEFLYSNGHYEEAALLREEGLDLAGAFDRFEDFMVLEDFTTI